MSRLLLQALLVLVVMLPQAAWAAGEDDLIQAAFAGDFGSAKRLVLAGASLNIQDENGYTPLHWAVYGKQGMMARYLVAKGASIDLADGNGYTPLILAAAQGETELVTILLNKGANPEARSHDGFSAIDYATAADHHDAAEVLRTWKQPLAWPFASVGGPSGGPWLPSWLSLRAQVAAGAQGQSINGHETHGGGSTLALDSEAGPLFGSLELSRALWGQGDARTGLPVSWTSTRKSWRMGAEAYGLGAFFKNVDLDVQRQEQTNWVGDFLLGSTPPANGAQSWSGMANLKGFGLDLEMAPQVHMGATYYGWINGVGGQAPLVELFVEGPLRGSVMIQQGRIIAYHAGLSLTMPIQF